MVQHKRTRSHKLEGLAFEKPSQEFRWDTGELCHLLRSHARAMRSRLIRYHNGLDYRNFAEMSVIQPQDFGLSIKCVLELLASK